MKWKIPSRESLQRMLEITALVSTIILLPIDRMPYLHRIPFSIGSISLLFLVLAAGLRLYELLKKRDYSRIKRFALIGSVIFLPVLGFAVSIPYALGESLATGATRYLLLATVRGFCCLILIAQTPALWQVVKKTIYILTTIIVAFGFFQFFFDVFGASTAVTDLRGCCTSNSTYVFPRVHSVAIEPLYFAHFLLLPLWLLVFDLFNAAKKPSKLLIALFIATGLIFVLTLARSALLGLVVSAAIYFGGVHKNSQFTQRFKKLALVAAVVAVGALMAVLLSGYVSRHIQKTAINGSDGGAAGSVQLFTSHAVAVADESAQTRYATWPKAFSLFKERPLLGVGAYNSRLQLNREAFDAGKPMTEMQPFNNDYLGTLVDLGLLGIFVFFPLLFLLGKTIRDSYKQHWNSEFSPVGLALIAIAVQILFFHAILLPRTWFIVCLTFLPLLVTKKTPSKDKQPT